MHDESTLTMAEIRSLVSEINSERQRLERTLALSQEEAIDGAVAVQTQAAARRDALVDALDRVRDGTFGTCARCGHGIPYGRLMVMPDVTYCIACQARP